MIIFYALLIALIVSATALFNELSKAQQDTLAGLPKRKPFEPTPGLSRREVNRMLRNMEVKTHKPLFY